MKVLLSLSLVCISLASCQAFCFRVASKTEIQKGKAPRTPSAMMKKLPNKVRMGCVPPEEKSPYGNSWSVSCAVASKLVPQDGCIDPYDGSRHPSGSEWNTDHCLRCTCNGDMECCTRYGGTAHVQDCKSVVNPETCQYEFYRIDNPSERCF